jgi:toxin ParE1/3/4
MTRLRWTIPANDDFLGIVAWIKDRNPEAAARVGGRILDAVESLARHPYLGKPGRVPDTRELLVTRFPYLVVYTVEAGNGTPEHPETVSILRVLHGAMLWPREGEGG